MPNIYTVAAHLIAQGVRIVPLESDWRVDYVFIGYAGFNICTRDADFDAKMQQAPRLAAALIEQYLRVVGFLTN